MRRLAFTLIEMLVVMAILVALAGMLVPIVVGAGETADELTCKNNLTQLGKAILDWRVRLKAGDDKFPGKLMWLSDETKGGGDLVGQYDIYLCPMDPLAGDDEEMGRPAGWNTGWDGDSDPYEKGCSYLYEVSNAETPSGWGLPANTTWIQYKRWQQKFGNSSTSYPSAVNGKPFPPSRMPIIRCFHHYDWAGVSATDNIQEVFNCSWSCNFFKSRPFWEDDV